MFRVDKGAGAAHLLHLGHNLQREGRLAGGFRAVDLDHTAARQAADAQRDIQAEGACRHNADILRDARVVHLHDGTLAELLLNLSKGGVQSLLTLLFLFDADRADRCLILGLLICCHNLFPFPLSGDALR